MNRLSFPRRAPTAAAGSPAREQPVGAGRSVEAGPVASSQPDAAEVEPISAAVGEPAAHLRVSRFRRGDDRPHFDDFEVSVKPGATLLDALLQIRRRQDPSLVVRHSCMHASCGTCGVRVNAREMLACDTRIADLPLAEPVVVEPLANQRVVADLATDMVDFYARFEAAGMPLVRAAEVGNAVQPPEGIRAFARFENCIECGLCLSSCPISRTNAAYLGPAALAAAARVVGEPRGQDLGPVLALAAEPDSVWGCHDALQCTAVCPAAVDPAAALLGLRRHVAFEGLKRLIRRSRGSSAEPHQPQGW